MRVYILPALGLFELMGGVSNEPSEREMQGAFADTLALQVQNALDFVRESEGADAVERLRASGHDRFNINAFRKLQCRLDEQGYLCAFAVDVGLVNGSLQRTMTGRFLSGPGGLIYAKEILSAG